MCVCFQRRRVHDNATYVPYAQMPACPLWSMRVFSLTLDCYGVFAIRFYTMTTPPLARSPDLMRLHQDTAVRLALTVCGKWKDQKEDPSTVILSLNASIVIFSGNIGSRSFHPTRTWCGDFDCHFVITSYGDIVSICPHPTVVRHLTLIIFALLPTVTSCSRGKFIATW